MTHTPQGKKGSCSSVNAIAHKITQTHYRKCSQSRVQFRQTRLNEASLPLRLLHERYLRLIATFRMYICIYMVGIFLDKIAFFFSFFFCSFPSFSLMFSTIPFITLPPSLPPSPHSHSPLPPSLSSLVYFLYLCICVHRSRKSGQ